MDREMQQREMRTLAASPDYVVGSVHALTEDGSLLIASASGGQLGPLVSGAGQVILVIGPKRSSATSHPACGGSTNTATRSRMPGLGEPTGCPAGSTTSSSSQGDHPGRVTAIIVNERLGF
jgi:hypothetical protein